MEKTSKELKKLETEEKRLQKMLDKAKKEGVEQEAATNTKMKIVQEQIEALSKELASQLEAKELVAQIEVKNNFTN